MTLQKSQSIDLIQVVENGCVQVREKTSILEDGVEISATYHRHVVAPGDDFSGEDEKVKNVCAVIHTPDVIAAYKALMEANQPKSGA